MKVHISAIFQKQLRDTFKNKTVLIQFVMFPVMTIIMSNMIKISDMPENFFVFLFAAMYVGMAPLTSMSAVIAEEKEKGILRILQLMNVKSGEYLLGTGSYVFVLCLLCSVVFPLCGNYTVKEILIFMWVMAVGILISVLVGGVIGEVSDNQMAATSITIPVMMFFSFLPMIGMFNSKVYELSKWTYTGQIQRILSQTDGLSIGVQNIVILAVNFIIALGLFVVAYQKAKKE